MGVTMHAKSDSEVTSIEASTPPRSPRRLLYYVQSPSHSQQDLEKMSYGSSPFGSPTHHYHCSPIHHSRESSTSRFSASLKNPKSAVSGWRRLQRKYDEMGDQEDDEGHEDEDDRSDGGALRFYVVCFLFSFVVLFAAFSLILWAASVPYKPEIIVKNIAFQNFNVQAGMDGTGVPTDMLTLNSTVKILYRNPATFFGVHVTSKPLEFHYYDLKLASGYVSLLYFNSNTILLDAAGHLLQSIKLSFDEFINPTLNEANSSNLFLCSLHCKCIHISTMFTPTVSSMSYCG
ncbi:Late embryogenesis abundant [Olea europaea subsp. europaea]|uniref:Late embryogenesis abundant n=1 Tax=Olea europaea subsp. europaea TaxID=158383 RepID=A0A8S0THL9_OLEEU|nr:Late embryogenesis abundant [Olea europaea subsp. europaea]